MIRTFAALAATAALAVPASADPVVVCRPIGVTGLGTIATVCAGADAAPDDASADPTVYWGCTIGDRLACTGDPITVGRTGYTYDGTIWVLGHPSRV